MDNEKNMFNNVNEVKDIDEIDEIHVAGEASVENENFDENHAEFFDEFFGEFQEAGHDGNDNNKDNSVYDDDYDNDERPGLMVPILAGVIGLAVVSVAGLFAAEKFTGKQVIPGFSLVQGVNELTDKVGNMLPDRKAAIKVEVESEAVTEAVITEAETEAVITEAATEKVTEAETEKVTEAVTEKTSEVTTEDKKKEKKKEAETELQTEMYVPAPEFIEENVYAFMQGPVAYKEMVPYSGEWFEKELAGTVFSEFGCGMCCMANLYSTFTPYTCSPLDMYEYAKEATDYNPGGGSGAIAWQYMQKALEKTGFATELHKKDELYRGLVRSMERGWAAVALVSCDDDPSFWQTTPGHYVTIWDYDSETRTVFLTDSGDPSHNRQRIPLQYVYSAFKSADEFQYLLITSYNEDNNTWKHDGIVEKWRNPKDPDTMKPDEKESETSKKEE